MSMVNRWGSGNIAPPDSLPEIPVEVAQLLAGKNIIDLTEQVKKQPPQPLYGRETEIQWIAARASAPMKNSLLLTGSAGVGKTHLYYHLAYLIAHQMAPTGLQNRRVFLLSSDAKKVLEVLGNHYADRCLLVADEVHSLIKIGYLDKESEDLKIFIGNGRTPFLGFTNRAEDFYIDEAWRRRFHIRVLSEMSIEDSTIAIERSKLQRSLEKQFATYFSPYVLQLNITQGAIELAVKLSIKYIPKDYLPDKGFKILEPACIEKIFKFLNEWTHIIDPQTIQISREDVFQYVMREFRVTREDVESKIEEVNRAILHNPLPLTEPLMRHCTNLNQLAIEGKISPAYGREDELLKAITTLSAIESNNVLLNGPAGSGKTRIGEGLAYKIVKGDVPESLKNMQVLLLDLNSLIGDTKYRGQFEEKIGEFKRSAEKYAGKFILMIDELHRMAGAGQTEHGNDNAAEQLKEPLARGKLRVIGMTTPEDFRAIEKDPAFLRRFTVQKIEPLSVSQTVEVLKADRPEFEKKYSHQSKRKFIIETSAIEAAAYLAIHYLPKEFLPSSGYKIFHGACGYLVVNGVGDLAMTEKTVIDFVNYFYQKERNTTKVTADLKRLKAELHPTNSLIPVHEPLARFTENWANKARQGLFKRSIHRENDIRDITNVLACMTINNVLLIGRAGSGKTSLAQELACNMANNEVPPFLQNRVFLTLKLQDFLDAVKTNPKIITGFIESARKYAGSYVLFIDEFHTFFQLATEEGLPIYEAFKPLLAEGKIRLIGATTPEEAKHFILNKGESILRRFSPKILSELTQSQSVDVLANSKSSYEAHYAEQFGHPFTIDPAVFNVAVQEASKKITFQALPASAITLLEETCSKKGMEGSEVIRAEDIVRYSEEKYPEQKRSSSLITRLFSWATRFFKFFWPFSQRTQNIRPLTNFQI